MTPDEIKIYYILPISRLPAIISEGFLLSDAEVKMRQISGEIIGMNRIKERRLKLPLASHPGLCVGECVPFYFCPRSIMLYVIHKGNSSDIEYRGGQEDIVHLVSRMSKAVEWADNNNLRWAFTDSNAGSRHFNDYYDLNDLDIIDWQAVQATQWSDSQIREKKQAEFLIEQKYPWEYIDEIGVFDMPQLCRVNELLGDRQRGLPLVRIRKTWYY